MPTHAAYRGLRMPQCAVPVTVTVGSAGLPSGYQIQLNVDTASLISAGKMLIRCSDIMFIDSDGVLMPHFVALGCNTSSTAIYVKIPYSIGANASRLIYMKYKILKPWYAPLGTDVFDRFTDFETTVAWVSGVTGLVTPGYLSGYGYGGGYAYGATGTTSKTISTSDAMYFGIDIMLPSSTTAARLIFLIMGDTYPQYWHPHIYIDSTLYADYYNTLSVPTSWALWEFKISSATSFSKIRVTFNKDHTTYTRYYPGIYVDNLAIAKYVTPEPTVSVGSETCIDLQPDLW